MCRYAMYGPYKSKWACFSCRKSFKRQADFLLPETARAVAPCPQCGTPMASLGLDFHVPKQSDLKQWRKVELLWLNGYCFHSCGCNGPGPRPKTLREVPQFLAEAVQAQERYQRLMDRQARAEQLKIRRRQKARKNEGKRLERLVAKEKR